MVEKQRTNQRSTAITFANTTYQQPQEKSYTISVVGKGEDAAKTNDSYIKLGVTVRDKFNSPNKKP